MRNFLLEQQQKDEKIKILNQFIKSNPDARELKRALAVKMAIEKEPYLKITQLLGVCKSYVTTWKKKFEAEGIEGIKLGYQGSKSYLTSAEYQETINWLETREYWDINELVTYLDENYGVIYQSKQSYYDLLSAAGISWQKSQKINPKHNPELVEEKREEIIEFIKKNQAEIESGDLVVFFIDECHLLGGDVCGYAWGKKKERIDVPIKNLKDRQTYYGALDYQTKEFIVREYDKGESENTIDFIQYLQSQRPEKRMALIWDGAKYHKSAEIKEFLSSVNDNKEPEDWAIHCIVFAANAPEQNPVEDVWLQAKNFLRKFWHLCKSFAVVKWLFKFFTDHQTFDFPKLLKYAPSS